MTVKIHAALPSVKSYLNPPDLTTVAPFDYSTYHLLLPTAGKGVNMTEQIECLDSMIGGCHGTVEYRMALSPTGRSFPRCQSHWNEAVDRDFEIRRRYPVNAPSDFDPMYAGERWDDDY